LVAQEGDGRGRYLGRIRGWSDACDDELYLELDQLGRELGESFVLPVRPALLQEEALAHHPAVVTQPLQEGRPRGGWMPHESVSAPGVGRRAGL
jgi:hypothetical protein